MSQPMSGTTVPVSMLERITTILDVFDRPGAALTLEEISRRTGLPRSTAHRILGQLAPLGWVRQTMDGYLAGDRIVDRGGDARVHDLVRSVAAETLRRLHLHTGMVVHLAALDGADEVFLDKIGDASARILPTFVGARLSAHQTPAGRAMLAALADPQVDALVTDRVEDSTSSWGWSMSRLHADLTRIRSTNGPVLDRSEDRPVWFSSVSTAFRTVGGSMASISLCPTSEQAPPLERVAPLVLRTARMVSQALAQPGRIFSH